MAINNIGCYSKLTVPVIWQSPANPLLYVNNCGVVKSGALIQVKVASGGGLVNVATGGGKTLTTLV
ncbi:MAG: hypothetical protein IPN86_10530 [Saprospiraceae bacterium]|nr:hypothetical protein [Saprospiraceae bacterium]